MTMTGKIHDFPYKMGPRKQLLKNNIAPHALLISIDRYSLVVQVFSKFFLMTSRKIRAVTILPNT
jgi:hypothetical protein